MRIIAGLSRYKKLPLLIATLYLALPSIACANEGPLWLYIAISPLIIFQQIPFLCPVLLAGLAIFLYRRIKTRSLALAMAGLLFLLAVVTGAHEKERRQVERHEREIHQQRIEANSARYKAMREGKPVAPLDEKALVAEARNHMKSSGDAEKDRLNREAAEDLVHMKVAIDAMMAGQQPPPSPKREPRPAEVEQDACSQWQAGKEASRLVAEARELHPEYARLSPGQVHAKGLEHYRRQEFASSIWAWECEALKNPQAKDGVNDIGIAYMELNNPPLSLAYAKKALNIDRNFAHAHHTAGRALLSMGRYSSARTSATAAIAGGWEPWWSYEILGLALRGMHDMSGGNEALRKAVAAQPGIQEIKWYADGNPFSTNWPDCWNTNSAADRSKMPADPPSAQQPKATSKHLAAEFAIWAEVKDRLPAGSAGRTMKELESEAGQLFGNNDSPTAAALWLKAAEAADNNQDKARCWSMAARAHGKMVDEVMQIAIGPRPQHRLSRELAEKALSMKPDDEDVVYTTALLQYKSVDFIKAADTLKTADQRIRLGLPSLHLMEVVYGLANDYKSQRDVALRIGYDPDKTVAGWKPYDWDMWHAKCIPSEMARRMKANGSSILTRESIIGGIFMFLMVAFSACCGWFAGKLFSARAASGWLHFAVVLCIGAGVVASVALLESFAGRIFNLAIAPWFYLLMTLPLTAISAYVFGVLARSFVKRKA